MKPRSFGFDTLTDNNRAVNSGAFKYNEVFYIVQYYFLVH